MPLSLPWFACLSVPLLAAVMAMSYAYYTTDFPVVVKKIVPPGPGAHSIAPVDVLVVGRGVYSKVCI